MVEINSNKSSLYGARNGGGRLLCPTLKLVLHIHYTRSLSPRTPI